MECGKSSLWLQSFVRFMKVLQISVHGSLGPMCESIEPSEFSSGRRGEVVKTNGQDRILGSAQD